MKLNLDSDPVTARVSMGLLALLGWGLAMCFELINSTWSIVFLGVYLGIGYVYWRVMRDDKTYSRLGNAVYIITWLLPVTVAAVLLLVSDQGNKPLRELLKEHGLQAP